MERTSQGADVLQGAFGRERERLEGIEALFDAPTRAVLERLGVRRGWHCADVGAGAGSITRWLADRVGIDGGVLAADVDVRFLDGLDRRNVEVRRLDISLEDLPRASFDLVYARALLAHTGPAAIERMLPGLMPGGRLLVIDMDWSEDAPVWPRTKLDARVCSALREVLEGAGCDTRLGRKLPSLLRGAGLRHIHAEPIQRIFQGGTELTRLYRLSMQALRAPVVARGLLTLEEVDRWLARLDDPEVTFLGVPLIACWGCAPT